MATPKNLRSFLHVLLDLPELAASPSCCLRKIRKAVVATEEEIEGIPMTGLSLVESLGYSHDGMPILALTEKPDYYFNTAEAAALMRETLGATEKNSLHLTNVSRPNRVLGVWLVPLPSSQTVPAGSGETKPPPSKSESPGPG